MRWPLIALLVLGCGDSGELTALKLSLANAQESIVETQSKQIDKTDEAIGILKDNTTALAAIKANIEALQVKSETPKGQEVIQSSEPPATANNTPNSSQVATPAASSRTASDGTVLRWSVEGNWDPTILETSQHLGQDHGINTDGMTHQQMADLHASLHDGKPVAMKSKPVQMNNRGSNCPNGQCPTSSTRQRRGLFGGLFR
jgi:hypothetical protein